MLFPDLVANKELDRLRLTMRETAVLEMLGDGDSIGVTQLADAMYVSHPAGTRAIERLVTLCLVERRQDTLDRRRTLCRLTPKGCDVLSAIMLVARGA